jgi:DNA polymerase I-like protein with 3'-5' exonuclease and polymerase domains
LGYTPLLQIHDELCFNVLEEDVKKIVKEMEGCVELNVPSVVDVALGNDFGSAT